MAKFDETSGKPHKGIYCAYVRVSTEDQDVARQKNWLKQFQNRP